MFVRIVENRTSAFAGARGEFPYKQFPPGGGAALLTPVAIVRGKYEIFT